MNRLRNRLILAFFAATILPLAGTIWITTSLLNRSLGYATTGELNRLSGTLETTARQLYQRERDALKQDVVAGRAPAASHAVADIARWPDEVRAFWESGEAERFALSGNGGDQLDYFRRVDEGATRRVETYRRDLRGVRMEELSAQLRESRQLIESIESRDLRRGFTLGPSDRVVVIEDVVSTGGSTRETMDVAVAAGATVVAAGAIIDRSGGSSNVGVPFRALVQLSLPTYEQNACPMCAAGKPVTKPGSRA